MAQGEFLFSNSTKPSSFTPPAKSTAKKPSKSPRQPPQIYSVTQLTRLIKLTLTQNLPAKILLSGEISNYKHHGSGHMYLTLKDEHAQIPAVMWKSAAARLKFTPTDGLAVIATGRIDLYEPQGKYQFYLEKLEPAGLGALELAFRQLAEKLRKEGLFDQVRKKTIPSFPNTIAIVTSPTGAAIRDIEKTLNRRCPRVRKLLFPVSVQGDAAAVEIAAALKQINRHHRRLGGIDLIIVTRGGGSIEDLWAFNEETVARAACASQIPIISGVGHETDLTIIDLIADHRAATPTAAAELAVPVQSEILQNVLQSQQRLNQALDHALTHATHALQNLSTRGLFARPLDAVRFRQQIIDELNASLSRRLSEKFLNKRRSLESSHAALRRIEPHFVLSRARTHLLQQQHLLQTAVQQFHQLHRHLIETLRVKITTLTPLHDITRRRTQITQLTDNLTRASRRLCEQRRRHIEHCASRCASVNPRTILQRGYSITRHQTSQTIVTDDSLLAPGDILITELAHRLLIESKVISLDKQKEQNDG